MGLFHAEGLRRCRRFCNRLLLTVPVTRRLDARFRGLGSFETWTDIGLLQRVTGAWWHNGAGHARCRCLSVPAFADPWVERKRMLADASGPDDNGGEGNGDVGEQPWCGGMGFGLGWLEFRIGIGSTCPKCPCP